MPTTLVIPQRIRCSRRSGFRLQAHSLALNGLAAWKVTRPSRFGNPFLVSTWGAAQAVALYETGLTHDPDELALDANARLWRAWVLDHVGDLTGYNLACFCALPAPYERDKCHAAVLLKLANPGLFP